MLSHVPEIFLGKCDCCSRSWRSWRDFLEEFDDHQPPTRERIAHPLTFRWDFRSDRSTAKKRAIDDIVSEAVAAAAENGFVSEFDEEREVTLLVGVISSFSNH